MRPIGCRKSTKMILRFHPGPYTLGNNVLSCLDKICKWAIFGLQGSLLTRFIPKPIILSSIHVSADPNALTVEEQHKALQRAITHRIQAVWEKMIQHQRQNSDRYNIGKELPFVEAASSPENPTTNVQVYITHKIFEYGKSHTESLDLCHGDANCNCFSSTSSTCFETILARITSTYLPREATNKRKRVDDDDSKNQVISLPNCSAAAVVVDDDNIHNIYNKKNMN
jgi:hypothetical protein